MPNLKAGEYKRFEDIQRHTFLTRWYRKVCQYRHSGQTPQTGRHIFTFEGGEDLTTMGAAWFVSYSYYDKIDKAHKNWEQVETYSNRKSVYNRIAQYHRFWLEKVLKMDTERLNTNTIGLTGAELQKMAQDLLNM